MKKHSKILLSSLECNLWELSLKISHSALVVGSTAHYSYFFFSFFPIFSRVISGVLCQNGQIETGDIYVLAAGIMVNPLGRTIGVNLPIYPLKGNVVTVPLKVIYNVFSTMGSMVIFESVGSLSVSGIGKDRVHLFMSLVW